MGLLDKIQAKLELYRLEQRYTRRNKRTTFVSDAQYVDGEYIYQSQGLLGRDVAYVYGIEREPEVGEEQGVEC